MLSPTLVAQTVVNGVAISAVYILVALGFTLIFGIMRTVNFAHGEFAMLGGFALFILYGTLKLDFFIALPLAALVVATGSLVFERLVFRPFYQKELQGMIATLGLSVALQYSAMIPFGPQDKSVPSAFTSLVELHGLTFASDRLAVLAIAAVVLLAFYLFMRFTKMGLAMRAAAQDPEIAEAQGIDSRRVYQSAFFLATLMAALAGGLIGQVYSLSPFMGTTPLVKAFTVVILGGLGSIPGAAAGGLLLGMGETFLKTFYGAAPADFASFGAIVLLLIWRPQGLFGRGEV